MARRAAPADDMYALGIIIYEMLTRALPWEAPPKFVIEAVKGGARPEIEFLRDDCEEDTKQLMEQCWAQERGDRPTAKDVLERAMAASCQVTLTKDAVAVGVLSQDLDQMAQEVKPAPIPARLAAMEEQLGLTSEGNFIQRLEQLEGLLGVTQTGNMQTRLAAVEAVLGL